MCLAHTRGGAGCHEQLRCLRRSEKWHGILCGLRRTAGGVETDGRCMHATLAQPSACLTSADMLPESWSADQEPLALSSRDHVAAG